MDFRLSDSPATSIGIAVGAALSFLLLLGMMPGLFLVTLLSGGSATMPTEDLLICQDTLSWPLARGAASEHEKSLCRGSVSADRLRL